MLWNVDVKYLHNVSYIFLISKRPHAQPWRRSEAHILEICRASVVICAPTQFILK